MLPLLVQPIHLVIFLGVEQLGLLLIYLIYYGIFARSVLLESVKHKDPAHEPLLTEDSMENIDTAVGSSTDLFSTVRASLVIKNHVYSCIKKLLDQNKGEYKKFLLITNGNRTSVFLDMIKYFYFSGAKVASHSYIPRDEFEICIEKGDTLEIDSFVDGILVNGRNLTRKSSGGFPSYCVRNDVDVELELICFKKPKENQRLENIATVYPKIQSVVTKDLEMIDFKESLVISSGLHFDEAYFKSFGIPNVQFFEKTDYSMPAVTKSIAESIKKIKSAIEDALFVDDYILEGDDLQIQSVKI
ncbi:hypothetical protein HDV01_003001 [Terramyces sp. JEL0728]|nr:hypothetical protein HDV01_003001 [Terramyces sp. JEL0728]